ncbi:uncharacterized protein N7515_007905 [Penicillium bovifimosum]|uniref:Zn(2)-C6 fungal-type domain-containing protein n=1 Tax=Penicillium bovifimosum TaxID=126998 RepID=A0A9W9GNI3_9EURO|nr:uncharacterized protein N7515_007905 [Penicillium bovifimosum]KAJ5124080.1 hypothetical protein N7515_007905 [Penicillium bovifimosum]
MEVTDTPRRRQSCDRCHGQKLRCTRASNDETGACIRCRRQGAQCIYSSSLPKGRPSMYRLDGPSSDSTTLPQVARPKPRSRQAPAVTASSLDHGLVTNIESLPDDKPSTNSHSPGNPGPIFPLPIDPSITWPSLPQSNLHEVEARANKQDGTLNAFDFIEQQMDCDLDFLNSVPGLLPWDNGDCSCLGGDSELAKTIDNGGKLMASNSSPDLGIVHLSQLSSRLVSLYQWSCAVANSGGSSLGSNDRDQGRPNSLINDVAFKSVASWLAHFSTEGNLPFCMSPNISTLGEFSKEDALGKVFTASYQFMETLRGLQDRISTGAPKPISNYSGGTFHNCGTKTSSTSNSTQNVPFPVPNTAENPSSRIVERHLVMACHTLLLKIYLAVFATLQYDVDRYSSRAGCGPVHQSAVTHPVSLADIRCVTVVQLCTYILDRQNHAVSGYLAPGSPPTQSMQLEPSYFPQYDATKGAECGPDLEVQSQLKRLRESLRI